MTGMKNRMRAERTRRGPIVRGMVAVAFAGLFAVSCDDVTGPEQLDTLTLTPAESTVEPTDPVQLTAVGTRAGTDVTTVVGATYEVTSGGGTVSAAGLFTAPSTPGTSTITVTCANLTATATVTVVPGPLATIEVTPNPVTLEIREQQQFTAVGRDAFNNIVEITPVWSTTNPPGAIDASTGLFTAGDELGTFDDSVRATSGSIFGTATVTVIAGQLATIEVTPNPVTLETGEQQQFTAVGRDAGGNVVPITPVWSTTNPPGTINASTGRFTAGNTTGTFNNSVRATSGSIFGTATVTVTAPAVPDLGFRMIARVAWTCTDGSIDGDIATNQTAGEVPPGAVTQTNCPVTGDIDIGTPEAKQAFEDFLVAYDDLEAVACETTLTGTLAGETLEPGVYCFDNAATLTGTLTLDGTATDTWLIKVGAVGPTGALTGTDFDVVMAGGASPCNVTWWVLDASTMTRANFLGHILAGAGVTFDEGGTYKGNAWSQEDVTVTGTAVTACDAP